MLGLIIDLSTAFLLNHYIGIPIFVCAAIGFLVGAIFNYLVHEKWTFGDRQSGLSSTRAILYVQVSCAALVVRMSSAYFLSPIAADEFTTLLVFFVSAGLSFLVNYFLSRLFVYK